MMPPSAVEPADLLDLKLLPAWVKEPAQTRTYAHDQGAEEGDRPRARQRPKQGRERKSRPPRPYRPPQDGFAAASPSRRVRDRSGKPAQDRHKVSQLIAPPVAVRFLPRPAVFENVVAQIKDNTVAYSLFALARSFLEKPERYEVRLSAESEAPLYQLGESGAVAFDREFLERRAFQLAHEDFYTIETTLAEPIKGNFSNVARCRSSGTLLGPTNHHNYQPQLRGLYEQRFSRRMSFADYQRQIEIVTDPALVEQWKEQARKIVTYTTIREETGSTFNSAVEAEQHFRQNYLPGLLRSVQEVTISGAHSRRLPDRALHRTIEDAWARETRSPSNVMQELAGRFREVGLHVFRLRRGMLFVTSIRPRAFVHDQAGVSPSVNAILETLTAAPGITRKELADKLLVDLATGLVRPTGGPANEEAERAKLALASNMHWLISEGYVIEFNDGSLDLPRMKTKPVVEAAVSVTNDGLTTAQIENEFVGSTESRPAEELEIGGS
jgi:hypothetical protein